MNDKFRLYLRPLNRDSHFGGTRERMAYRTVVIRQWAMHWFMIILL